MYTRFEKIFQELEQLLDAGYIQSADHKDGYYFRNKMKFRKISKFNIFQNKFRKF